MKYQPEIAKCQVIVYFKNCGEDFAKTFGEKLGYELIEEYEFSDNGFIFKTPVDGEQEAIEKFEDEKYKPFVENADLRDLKLEQRIANHHKLEGFVNNLDAHLEAPDDVYILELEKIINRLEKMKDER